MGRMDILFFVEKMRRHQFGMEQQKGFEHKIFNNILVVLLHLPLFSDCRKIAGIILEICAKCMENKQSLSH